MVSLTPIIHLVITPIPLTIYKLSFPFLSTILLVPRRIITPLIFRAKPAKKIDLPNDDSACNKGSQECTLTMGSLISLITIHLINILLPSIFLFLVPISPPFHMNTLAPISPYISLYHIATLRSPLSLSSIITLIYLNPTPSIKHTNIHLSLSAIITIRLIITTLPILFPVFFVITRLTLSTPTIIIISPIIL